MGSDIFKAKIMINEIILQERRTLDEVLLTGIKIFKNGCNYRLVKDIDNLYYLEYGCSGRIKPTEEYEQLLHLWFKNTGTKLKKLSGIVKPETISFLLKRKPCKCCGGTRFRKISEPHTTLRILPKKIREQFLNGSWNILE